MIKNINILDKTLFYRDNSKRPDRYNYKKLLLSSEERELILAVNRILYEITFRELDKFWTNHVLYYPNKNRHTPITEHFENDPYYQQLKSVESYLNKEYQSVKYFGEENSEPCEGCYAIKKHKNGNTYFMDVSIKTCNKMCEQHKCKELEKIKKES